MMHFLGGSESAFALALLTQRMQQYKSRAEFLPRATVTFVGIWVSQVFVVLTIDGLPVLVTVLTICQPSASRVGARTLGFPRHDIPPGYGKEPSRSSRRLPIHLLQLYYLTGVRVSFNVFSCPI